MTSLLTLLALLALPARSAVISGTKRTNVIIQAGVTPSSQTYSGSLTVGGVSTFNGTSSFNAASSFNGASQFNSSPTAITANGDIVVCATCSVYWKGLAGPGQIRMNAPDGATTNFRVRADSGTYFTGHDSNGFSAAYLTRSGPANRLVGVISTATDAGTGLSGFGVFDLTYGPIARAVAGWQPSSNALVFGGTTLDANYGSMVLGYQDADRFYTSSSHTVVFQQDASVNDLTWNMDRADSIITSSTSYQYSLSASNIGGILLENGHLDVRSHVPPSIACNAGVPSVGSGSSDQLGHFTPGAGATSCTLTFAHGYPLIPVCMAFSDHSAVAFQVIPNLSTVQFETAADMSGGFINYFCMGAAPP